MVAFRGDYVHGGTFYDLNHTRIFMGFTMVEDVNINTPHLEENKKRLPFDSKGDREDAEGGESGSRGKVEKRKKRKL